MFQLKNWLPNSPDLNTVYYLVGGVATDGVLSLHFPQRSAEMRANGLSVSSSANGPITIAIRARFEYDSTTIRLQHATTRYEVFRALAYEIVYENQW